MESQLTSPTAANETPETTGSPNTADTATAASPLPDGADIAVTDAAPGAPIAPTPDDADSAMPAGSGLPATPDASAPEEAALSAPENPDAESRDAQLPEGPPVENSAAPAEENSGTESAEAPSAAQPQAAMREDGTDAAAEEADEVESALQDEASAEGPDTPGGGADVQQWWTATEVPGKDFAELREDGSLFLRATASAPERRLGTLRADTKEATVKALTDKHTEVVARVEEVETAWGAAEQKTKLEGRVSRLREYLQHSVSLGDYEALFAKIGGWEATLRAGQEESSKTKGELVEEAEAIAAGTDWKAGSARLREIGDRFREAGSGGAASPDELRARLDGARDLFFDRKRAAQEEEEKEALRALDLKLEIVDEAENLAKSEAWRQTTEAYKTLLDRWKAAGRAGGDRGEELWRRFTAAQNAFFDRKRAHYKSIQKEQDENMHLKEALIERAEALQESQDWGPTAKAYADLMDEWKRIGRVPEEKKEDLWGRFAAAKERFFSARRAILEGERVALSDNYARKLALLKRAETLRDSTQWREATDELTELMEEWKTIGPVPREHSKTMWQSFLAARTEFFKRKDADRDRRRERAAGQQAARADQTRTFLKRVEEELAEEADRLQDFRESLENVGTGPKSAELTAHLTKLIEQTEVKVKRKEEKVAEVRRQMQDIDRQARRDGKPARGDGEGGKQSRRETEDGAESNTQGQLLQASASATSTGPETDSAPLFAASEEDPAADGNTEGQHPAEAEENRGSEEFAPEAEQPSMPADGAAGDGMAASTPVAAVTAEEHPDNDGPAE